MIAYKIVHASDQGLFTHVPWIRANVLLCTRYIIGEWVQSPLASSGLFVFLDLSEAETEFRRKLRPGSMLFQCEITSPREINVVMNPPTARWAHCAFLNYFWKGGSLSGWDSIRPPKGTYVVDSVRLTKRIACYGD